MLLNRSIFLQVCLLLIVSQQSKCEDYESSYESDANDESDHPDYSKYYSTDTSAPLVQGGEGGFSSPIEFSGFFGPEFGESGKQEVKQPKNPFVQEAKAATTGFVSNSDFPTDFFTESHSHYPKDYFEEAQKEQQNEQSENDDESYNVAPGPNYISHQLPTIKEVADFSTEVEHVKPKITKNKYRKNEKYGKDYEESLAEGEKYKLNDYPYDNSKYATDYTIGKSSSTVSQKPKTSGYYAKSTASPTPYQKYSFQPVTEGFEVKSKYLGDLISTVAPFNPAYNKVASTPSTLLFEGAPSEAIPSQLQGHNCKRVTRNIEKDVDNEELKGDSMNCFVCEDPKTSSEYTHCSYISEPDTKNDYSGTSIRYSTPTRDSEDGFRYKRYSGDDYNANPYEYIRSRSQKAQKQAEETKHYDEYKLPDYYGFDDDKSYSESQSEQIKQNPANCKKEEKKGMTCTVCKDPKTGGNFEQCSYTSEPQEQKYAYVAEKKYDSNDDEPGEESEESKKNPQIAKKDDKESAQDKQDKIPETVIQDYIKQKVPTTVEYKKEPRYEESNTKYTKFDEFEDIKKEKPLKVKNSPSKLKNYNEHKNKYSKLTNYKPEDHEHKFSKLEKFDPEEHEEKTGQSQTEERYHFKNPEYDEAKEYVTGAPPSTKPKKLVDDDPYEVPKHFAESTIKERQTGGKGLESSLYGNSDESSAEAQEEEENDEEGESESDVQPYKDIDEYHFKLFPEFSNEESQQAEVVAAQPKDDTSRKDVEEVLAEFSKKDRSSCKKAERNGMTCYLCVDKKGIQHEECMYVSESKPQASHVAYHEVKQIKSPENGENQQLEQAIPAATEIKRKRFFKKVTTTPLPFTLDEAASEEIETKIRYKPTKSRKRNQKKAKELKSSSSNKSKNYSERIDDKDEPQQKTPQEFEVGPTEGAYSAETKPVYSKVLGVRLPKYMVEKSEFEKEFDEFSGSF